jgi:hypothetical protein
MADKFNVHRWFKNQYLNENKNAGKYEAIEKALSILTAAGYTMNDAAYKALTAERARLEKQ